MNYSRYFNGKEKMAAQPMVNMASLGAMYKGRFFDIGTVNKYNQFTKHFNTANNRASQERILDERQCFMLKVIQGASYTRQPVAA